MDNLGLWDELREVPPEARKAFKKAGGFSGTSIDPTWRIRRLTEIFGECGTGWRFVITNREVIDVGGKKFFYVTGRLEVKRGEQWCSSNEHTGGTDSRVPDEAWKCSETDSFGKCCLDFGLGADVYTGAYDGDKYQRPDPAPPQHQQAPRQPQQQQQQNYQPAQQQQAQQQQPQQQQGPPVRLFGKDTDKWHESTIHFGKNKGVALGSMSVRQLEWYLENARTKIQQGQQLSEQDQALFNALSAWWEETHRDTSSDSEPTNQPSPSDEPW